MAKKSVNTKVEAANNRKAASKAEKDAQRKADLEAKEDAHWAKGAKKNDKKEAEAEKKAAALQRKLEAKKLLEEEESTVSKPKAPKPNYTKKFEYNPNKKSAKAKAAAKAASKASKEEEEKVDDEEAPAKKILSEKDIEKHPERRFKTALKNFEERELKNYRAEYPGLRLTQLKEIMYKDFQKSPDNPFNQSNVFAYNTSLEEVNRKLYGEPEPKEEEKNEAEGEAEGEDEEEKKDGETQAPLEITAPKQAVASY